MINGLNLPSHKSQIGNGLELTETNLKGRGCNINANKKSPKQHGRGLTILK